MDWTIGEVMMRCGEGSPWKKIIFLLKWRVFVHFEYIIVGVELLE